VFVELIEMLRCPRPHAESQLVVAAGSTVDRHITAGTLGCPVCNAEFSIANGVARFDKSSKTPAAKPHPETALKLAALLDLSDPRGFALLTGAYCAQLDGLQRLVEASIVLQNPPGDVGGIPAGLIVCADVAPFAPSSLRAAAIDASTSEALRASIVRCVQDGGRIIGPISMPVPADVNELDRDSEIWVGERLGKRPLVSLKRA
jgi:uncharacterized protein YbaR (Trm112 family)